MSDVVRCYLGIRLDPEIVVVIPNVMWEEIT